MKAVTSQGEFDKLEKYKPYQAYKDLEVEWLGKVPEWWQVKKIKHTTYVKGRIGWQNLRNEEFSDTGVLCITGTDFDLGSGIIDFDNAYRVSEERYSQDPHIQLRENDLLITKDGSIGKIGLVKGLHERATLNSGIFVTRPLNKAYLQEYMYWVLNSVVFRDFINYLSSGTTINHLYQNIFERFVYPLPDLNEQKAIHVFLDHKTHGIDALIAKQEQLIGLLQEERAALITNAVTKGLDPDAPMKDSGVKWLGEIPAHWNIVPLKRFGEFQGGAGFPNEYQGHEDDELPFYKVSDTNIVGNEIYMRFHNNSISKDTAHNLGAFVFPQGTIIFPKVGAALLLNKRRILTKPACIDNNMMGFIANAGDLTWLYYWMCGLDLGRIANPGAVPSINEGQIRDVLFPVPHSTEQRAIGQFLLNTTNVLDKVTKAAVKSVFYLEEYRTALISAAVTGKIDVREEVSYS